MGTIRHIAAFAWPYVRPYSGRLALGVALAMMFGLFNATFVWGTKTLFERLSDPPAAIQTAAPQTDEGFNAALREANANLMAWIDPWLPKIHRPLDWRQALGGLLFLPLLAAVRGAISYSTGYCLSWVSTYAVRDLRLAVQTKLQSLSLDYFQRRHIGEHTMLLNNGAVSLSNCLHFGIADTIKEPFTILGIGMAMFLIDWRLAFFGLLLAPLSLIPIVLIGRKLRRLAQASYSQGTEQDGLMVEVYRNVRTVQAYGLAQVQQRRFAEIYQRLARLSIKKQQAKLIFNPLIEIISAVGVGVVIVFVFAGGFSVPELAGFLMGLVLLYQPIKKLGSVNNYFQEASVGVAMLETLFAQKPTVVEKPGALTLAPLVQELRWENVTFAYDGDPVLREVDVVVPRGTKLGIAGESGAGKSSLLLLLCRFFDPTAGRLTIDGSDIKDTTLASLRGQMALVSQEVVIFNMTVAENIALGKTDATQEEIVAAAKAAGAHGFISELPQGYDTPLGEQGTRLSGGQRQRIAIARAFIRQAAILILDEATAALDSQAEVEVQAAIERLEEGRTVICVAHRLSTLCNMDQIILLEDGRIVESGTFSELLRSGGRFAQMAAKQGISENLLGKSARPSPLAAGD